MESCLLISQELKADNVHTVVLHVDKNVHIIVFNDNVCSI